MAGGGSSSIPLYYKDITHNLGYKPIVRAFVYMGAYSVIGWREVPINFYVREVDPDYGVMILDTRIFYEHLNDNTIRFYGPQDTQVKVTLYIEPRKDAWYG